MAHEHHTDEIAEGEAISAQPIVPSPSIQRPGHSDIEHQDTTLWIHIAIQIASFAIIFPTGMVLGVYLLLFTPKSQICRSDRFLDHSLTMARTSPSPRRPFLNSRLLPGPCPRWSPIRP